MGFYDGQDMAGFTEPSRVRKCAFRGCPNKRGWHRRWCHAHERQGRKGGVRRPILAPGDKPVLVCGVVVSRAHAGAIYAAAGTGQVDDVVKRWVAERAEVHLALANHAKEAGVPGVTLPGDTYKVLWLMAERKGMTVHGIIVQALNEWVGLNRPQRARMRRGV